MTNVYYFLLYQVELKKNKRIYAMKVVKKELVNDDEVGVYPKSACL